MKAIEVRKNIQRLLFVTDDGDIGRQTRAALDSLSALPDDSEWPVPKSQLGDGTWPWTAEIVGEDIVVRGARATCFGGSNDPQDNGETASGVSTKLNPEMMACSLPMDGRMFSHLSSAEHAALDGSPIPRVPWKTEVRVTNGIGTINLPVIDLGPAKKTGNAIDLTIPAARFFKPTATARNFEARVDFTIIGGAKFLT